MQTIRLGTFLGTFALLLLGHLQLAQGFTLKPYGYIKADLTMDMGNPNVTAGGYGTNYVRWLDPKPEERPMTWGLTGRQSRLGFDFVDDQVDGVEVLGRIETDFTNPPGEYVNGLKLRKAYLKVATPSLELLAGQESDIFSPLVPDTVSYLVAWWAGNIGFRRPQVRLTYKLGLGESTGIDVSAGVERTIRSVAEADNYDVAIPTFAGRIGFRSPLISVGVSGHYGKEREQFAPEGQEAIDEVYDSYSANLDLLLNLGQMLTLSGEVYHGKNLDTYFGGIGQGVVLVTDAQGKVDGKELADMGFWAQLKIKPSDRLVLNLGQSMTMVEEEDVPDNGRTGNQCTYANLNYMLAKDVWVALEGSLWQTSYKDARGQKEMDSDDYRGQLAFIYNFK